MSRWLGLGRKKEPRRSSDDDYGKMQHWTPRGSIPAKVVEQQTQEVFIDPKMDYPPTRYPHNYKNDEPGNPDGRNFAPYEQRNRPETTPLYEVPIGSRMNLDKKATPYSRVKRQEEIPTHPNDRGRVVKNELNDPGPFRGIVSYNETTGQSYGVAGVLYHPEGNAKRFDRARMEPMDREGRQYLSRFRDDAADPHRVTTWPPRDEDGDDLANYESRYKQVRRPRPPQMQKTKKR